MHALLPVSHFAAASRQRRPPPCVAAAFSSPRDQPASRPAHGGAARALVAFAASLALLQGAPNAGAASPPAVLPDRPADETDLLSDFNVSFMSQKVDHRVIVELVVAGQTVGFVGALVAGLAAKERKEEAERLNKRLVAVNKQLREVARADRKRESTAAAAAAAPQHTGAETQPADGPAQELLSVLRGGKALLKQRDGAGAKAAFGRALSLARAADPSTLDSQWRAERKALRGLGAAAQLCDDHKAALEAMQQVLAMSEQHGDGAGVSDALGVIADIYTSLGDFDKAGVWYDKYLKTMLL